MTFQLGQAEFILKTNNEDAIKGLASYFHDVTKTANDVTKVLAKELDVRKSDVRAAATILITEDRKAAAEQVKIQKEAAAERKKEFMAEVQERVRELKDYEAAYKKSEQEIASATKQAGDERQKASKAVSSFEEAQLLKSISGNKAALTQRVADLQKEIDQEIVVLKTYASQQANIQSTMTANVAKANAEQAANTRAMLQNNIQQQKAAQAQIEALNRQTSSSSSSGFFGISGARLGATAATLLGFGAIASTAVIAREAIVSVTDALLTQEQATRALNGAFGKTADFYKSIAIELSNVANKPKAEVEQAIATFAALDKQSNLSSAQLKELAERAVDLQAAFGGDLREVFRNTQNAVLGETEGFEKFGLVLQQNVLKASDLLTESEKRRFTTMSQSEQQAIRYRLIMSETAGVVGSAAKRANEAAGGFDALNKAWNDFSLKRTEGTSGISQVERQIANLINLELKFENELTAVDAAIEKNGNYFEKWLSKSVPLGVGSALVSIFDLENIKKGREEIQAAADALSALSKSKEEAATRTRDLQAAENDRVSKENAARKIEREQLEREVQRAHDVEVKRIEDAIDAANAEKVALQDAIKKTEEADLERLRVTEEARHRASELELARIENEKNAALKAAEARKDSEIHRIDVEKTAAKNATDEQIRQLKIVEEAAKRSSDEQERVDLHKLELQKEEREKTRTEEDRSLEAATLERNRKEEDNHKNTLTRLEREGEALRRNAKTEEDGKDKNNKKEEERHKKRVQDIEDESKKATRDIDDQIAGIEAIQKARANANKTSQLNTKLTDAQTSLREATGTGDTAAGVVARDKLTAAIRINDPVAIQKATDELKEIVGQGTKAIVKAQQDVADVQHDIVDENLTQSENAEKDKLQASKDRIKQQEDDDKQQEEKKNTRIKNDVDNSKKAEKTKLDDALQKLELRVEAENRAYENKKRKSDDTAKKEKDDLTDVRKAEDIAYTRSEEVVKERHRIEQEQINDTYNGEDHGYIPAIRRALDKTNETYDAEKAKVEERYKAEQDAIHETYDNPDTGLIAVHRRAEEDAQNKYQAITRTVRIEAENARQAVERAYNNPDKKSGIIDKLHVMKDEADEKLKELKQAFQDASAGLVGPQGVITLQWQEAIRKANEYFDLVKKRGGETATPQHINPVYGPAVPGSSYAPGEGPGNSGDNAYGNQKTGQYISFGGFNKVELGSNPGTLAPDTTTAYDGRINNDAVEKRIRQWFGQISDEAASDAVEVFNGEGRSHYIGDFGTSFGPFQLHVGGGLGDAFTRDTGLDPRDPNTMEQQIQWVVNYVANNGWNGQWHGAPSKIKNKSYRDEGYLFKNPTTYMDMVTGERGVLAERGPERLLGREATRYMDISMQRSIGQTQLDYATVGARINSMPLHQEINSEQGGDSFHYNGVAPENIMQQWRDDQRRQSVLRGLKP